jgi:putative tryptophan/tyrosine transport system substrate-binding protein
MNRRAFIALLGGAAAAPSILWPLAPRAQQSNRMRRIGVLMGVAESDPEGKARANAFRKGLEDSGWVDGRNVQIEYRWVAGDVDRIGNYAAELVRLAPDVILATASPLLAALLAETRTIPIVFVQVSDPVGQGFVDSLASPGANITGFTNFEFSMMGKWLEMLKEIAPGLRRVALMFNPETAANYFRYYLAPFESAAPMFGLEPIVAAVHDDAEIDHAMGSLARERNGGLLVMSDVFTAANHEAIVASAARYRLPTIYPFRYFAVSGGLLSYGSDTIDLFRRSASYVDRILKGAKPGELPVQQPTKFELVVNLKTAKALGLDLPQTLLALADEVIE